MKKFRFQLESVLNFRDQQLDALMEELGRLQSEVRLQEEVRNAARERLARFDEDTAIKKAEGMTILEALEAETSQQVLSKRLRAEEEKLEECRRALESKRQQVIEARKEIRSLEKLKEVRRDEYDKAALKAEEKQLDDMTAARRAAEAS